MEQTGIKDLKLTNFPPRLGLCSVTTRGTATEIDAHVLYAIIGRIAYQRNSAMGRPIQQEIIKPPFAEIERHA